VESSRDAKQGFTQSWLARYSKEHGEESLERYRRMKKIMQD